MNNASPIPPLSAAAGGADTPTGQMHALLKRHAELLFVLALVAIVALAFHWMPHKLAFLNFFYLPVLAAGYLLGARRALAASVLCVLLVILYYLWLWMGYAMMSVAGLTSLLAVIGGQRETAIGVAIWAGFLVVAGAVFGSAHERIVEAFAALGRLADELKKQSDALGQANEALKTSSAELQHKAEELQGKNLLVERLKQQVEEALYSTMDATVARLMMQGRLREQKRTITVLSCDLKGLVGLDEQKHPEVVLEMLNQFYEGMEQIVDAYHGHIDRYMGDGVMCEFGAPIDYELHALQAAIAAVKVRENLAERHFPYALRIGIATGDAIVGLLGSRRRSYSAIGDVVNLSKRLQQLCEPGCVYLDQATYQEAKRFIRMEPVRHLAGRRPEDAQLREELEQKETQLAWDPENVSLLFEVGNLYLRLREATKAMLYYRRAMALRPDDNALKLAYADATVKRDEYENINVRGVPEQHAVYKTAGLVDPLMDRDRFSAAFHERYKHVPGMIEIPENVVLPTESIDASIGHSVVVATLAYAIADSMGLPEPLKGDLLIAGRLQDAGKCAVWHSILTRRGALSEQERKDLEKHVDESVSVTRRLGYDRPEVLEIIANHHELLDGSGYPRRVKGEDIPLGARIACVADLYAAMTAWRPYRSAWDSRVALKELGKQAGDGCLDRRVVEASSALLS
jgi:adenylate cyclase